MKRTVDRRGASSFARYFLALAALGWSATGAGQAVLEEIRFTTGAGGAVDIVLDLAGAIPEPEVFTTDNPARIALDLPGTTSALERRTVAVGTGATRSVTAVQSGDRTRVVIDLFRSTEFDTRREGDAIIVSVSGGTGGRVAAEQDRSPIPGLADSAPAGVPQIRAVDFRRGDQGEGRIIVDFSDPGANVDLSRQGQVLNASIYDAGIPPEREQRLDVMDFATPVDLIDVFRDGNRVRLVVNVTGAFEHLAYQSGTRYVIEVQEYVAPEPTPEELVLEPPEYEGTRVTFNFQDIPVRAVLQLIADVSGLNVVVADSVSGNITLRLQNVPWDQALDIILQAKSLDKRQVGNVVWIAPAQEIAAREQQQLAALKERRRLEPLVSTFIQANYAKAIDLAALIREASAPPGGAGLNTGDDSNRGLLSARGSVSVDERTNVLLVSDTSDRIDAIRELVNILDRPVRQVQIEARIVVANDEFSDEIGVRFGLTSSHEDSNGNIYTTSGSVINPVSPIPTAGATDRLIGSGLRNRLDGQPSNPLLVPPTTAGGGLLAPPVGERLNVNLPTASTDAGRWGFSILAADYLLDLELSALESEGRGEVISSPRLITANQKESFIRQGVQIPFQQATAAGAAAIQFQDAVLELRVQPLITPDNRVILDLTVSQDTVGERVPVQGGGEVPSIDTRRIETQVLVDTGQTVVLGGIYEQVRNYQQRKVPGLGDLPGVGALFRQRSNEDEKRELLIFVTPTILDDAVGAF